MKFRSTASAGTMTATILSMAMAAAALAGPRYADPSVTIVRNADGSGRAYGTLGGVRNSTSTVEKLSCSQTRTAVLNAAGSEVRSTAVNCVAVDKGGVSVVCTSRLESFADALSGVSNDGLIEFTFNAAGTCTQIYVYESSSLERKR